MNGQNELTLTADKAEHKTEEKRSRLVLYNKLFTPHTKKTICEKTRLQLTTSLNYFLFTLLHLSENDWVLAMIDVDDYENMAKKYGSQRVSNKVNQIGTVVYNFCQNNPNKLKAFRCKDVTVDENEDKYDVFAIVMCCISGNSSSNLFLAEKYINKLVAKIKQQTNETVSVGIAKMNDWESFEEWKQRGLKNITIARTIALKNEFNTMNDEKDTNGTIVTKTQNSNVYSDINVKYVNSKVDDNLHSSDKKEKEKSGYTLGNKEEFDTKMQEIANNEDYEWMIALLEIDDFSSFVFLNNDNKHFISKEKSKIAMEMYDLFNVYGGSNYFGYKWNGNEGGDTYGMILYDSKDANKCLITAIDLIEALKDEIKQKCPFTVSIGCGKLEQDDLGMTDDWYERITKYLHKAKKTGGNLVIYRKDRSNTRRESNVSNSSSSSNDLQLDLKSNNGDQEKQIETNTLSAIKVCLLVSETIFFTFALWFLFYFGVA